MSERQTTTFDTKGKIAERQILKDIGMANLPNDWDVVTLERLLINDRGISVGVMYPGEHAPGGIPLIRAGDLKGDQINSKPELRISLSKHQEYKRTELEGGELLISLVGDVGRCAVVPTYMAGWNAARAIAVLRFKAPSDVAFVRLCLMSQPLQHLMFTWATTTVQATLNLREIRQIPVPWPSNKERQAIASILSSLDDKIELNRRMKETLEVMARTIFKDWFVDFGPTRAKQEGRTAYLPEHLWSLFPEAIDEETGLPMGWEEVTISQYLDVKRGGSPRPIKDYIVPVGIPWVKIADATSINSPFIFSTKEFIKPEGLRNTINLKEGSLILSNSATPGLPRFLMIDACIHDGWLYFPKIDKFSKEYLYLLFLSIRENLVGQ